MGLSTFKLPSKCARMLISLRSVLIASAQDSCNTNQYGKMKRGLGKYRTYINSTDHKNALFTMTQLQQKHTRMKLGSNFWMAAIAIPSSVGAVKDSHAPDSLYTSGFCEVSQNSLASLKKNIEPSVRRSVEK
jgi:hypothetical protein